MTQTPRPGLARLELRLERLQLHLPLHLRLPCPRGALRARRGRRLRAHLPRDLLLPRRPSRSRRALPPARRPGATSRQLLCAAGEPPRYPAPGHAPGARCPAALPRGGARRGSTARAKSRPRCWLASTRTSRCWRRSLPALPVQRRPDDGSRGSRLAGLSTSESCVYCSLSEADACAPRGSRVPRARDRGRGGPRTTRPTTSRIPGSSTRSRPATRSRGEPQPGAPHGARLLRLARGRVPRRGERRAFEVDGVALRGPRDGGARTSSSREPGREIRVEPRSRAVPAPHRSTATAGACSRSLAAWFLRQYDIDHAAAMIHHGNRLATRRRASPTVCCRGIARATTSRRCSCSRRRSWERPSPTSGRRASSTHCARSRWCSPDAVTFWFLLYRFCWKRDLSFFHAVGAPHRRPASSSASCRSSSSTRSGAS